MIIIKFRKEKFDGFVDLLKKARNATSQKINIDVVEDVKVNESDFNNWLQISLSDEFEQVGPYTGWFKIINQDNPSQYYYADKQGYNYLRYIGIDDRLKNKERIDVAVVSALTSLVGKTALGTWTYHEQFKTSNTEEYVRTDHHIIEVKGPKGKMGALRVGEDKFKSRNAYYSLQQIAEKLEEKTQYSFAGRGLAIIKKGLKSLKY